LRQEPVRLEVSEQETVNTALRLRKKGILQGSCAAAWSTRAQSSGDAATQYSTLATKLPDLDGKLGQGSALVLDVRGNGRAYSARLLQPMGTSSIAFQKSFFCGESADPDSWVEVQIPLGDLVQEDETLGSLPLDLPGRLELRTAHGLKPKEDSVCEIALVYLKNAGEGIGPQVILPGPQPKVLVDDLKHCDSPVSSLGSSWQAVFNGLGSDRYSEVDKLLTGYSRGTCSLLWTDTGVDAYLELNISTLRAPLSTKLINKTLVLVTRGSGDLHSIRLSSQRDSAAEQVFKAEGSEFRCGDPANWGKWTRTKIDLASFSAQNPDGSFHLPTADDPGPPFLWSDVQKLILKSQAFMTKANSCEIGLVYFEETAPPPAEQPTPVN
jgi:hypothetical protein